MEPLDEIDDEDCLATQRLVLRPLHPAHAEAMERLANDRHIAEMTARIPHPYSRADADMFIALETDEKRFALTLAADGVFCGIASLIPRGPAAYELGYWLGRPFWGAGLATQAAQRLVDHAFADLAAERVEVRCRVINGASKRVVQKCGFHYVGTGMDHSRSAGRVASERFAMDRRCWQSLKSWGGR